MTGKELEVTGVTGIRVTTPSLKLSDCTTRSPKSFALVSGGRSLRDPLNQFLRRRTRSGVRMNQSYPSTLTCKNCPIGPLRIRVYSNSWYLCPRPRIID